MSSDQTESRSPFTRPGFIAAAVVVALILGMAMTLVIMNATGKNSAATTSPSASASAESSVSSEPGESSEPASNGEASVCGLKGEVLEKARLPQRPKAENWDYVGGIAYPVSKEYGPGATAPEGYQYCFQRSPEGALFAASYMVAASAGAPSEWHEYAVSKDAPNRSELIKPDERPENSYRAGLGGFRLQSYDGKSATIELALWAKTGGATAYGSAVYHLVWEDGDWKFRPKNAKDPLESVQLPDIADYVPWGE